MDWDEIEMIVLVPARIVDGVLKPHPHDMPPYGYHHIVKVYQDRSDWVIATLDHTWSADTAVKVVEQLEVPSHIPVVIDQDYYVNRPR